MKDEKNDLQKQIGCITGFFQLFDRHRFITGQRNSGYIPNSSSSGIQVFKSSIFCDFVTQMLSSDSNPGHSVRSNNIDICQLDLIRN